MLNRRCKHKMFKPLSDRVAVMDLCIEKGQTARFVAVYMPHAEQPDDMVDTVYEHLDETCKEARAMHRKIIVAGDLNTEVGATGDFDDAAIIGDHSMQSKSDRGEALLRWCTFQKLVITNTFSNASQEDAWTYRNGSIHKV